MRYHEPVLATLPNGHSLVADRQTNRVNALDRSGRIVREFKNADDVYRVRRRGLRLQRRGTMP